MTSKITEEEFCRIVEESQPGTEGCEERCFASFISKSITLYLSPQSKTMPYLNTMTSLCENLTSLGFVKSKTNSHLLTNKNYQIILSMIGYHNYDVFIRIKPYKVDIKITAYRHCLSKFFAILNTHCTDWINEWNIFRSKYYVIKARKWKQLSVARVTLESLLPIKMQEWNLTYAISFHEDFAQLYIKLKYYKHLAIKLPLPDFQKTLESIPNAVNYQQKALSVLGTSFDHVSLNSGKSIDWRKPTKKESL